MKLLGLFAFMLSLGVAFCIGVVFGMWGATKGMIEHLLKEGWTIVPPKED